jgi:hypothetical protein
MSTRNALHLLDEKRTYDYENPSIADEVADKVKNTVSFVSDRKWSITKAALKAGITKQHLSRLYEK